MESNNLIAPELECESEGVRIPGSSDVTTALLILKSTIGGTLILIPGGFKEAGLVFAPLEIILIGGAEIYCMLLLLHCSRACSRSSYGEIAQQSMGRLGRNAVDASLVLSQLGFVCAEMLYVAKNVHSGLEGIQQDEGGEVVLLSEVQILGLLFCLTAPLTWIRHLKYFKMSNLLANISVLVALFALATYAAKGLSESGPGEGIQVSGHNRLLFTGTIVFSFECINFVLPMYEAHERKDTFAPVLVSVLSFVLFLFVGFGALNYVYYGAATKPVVTMNLHGDTLVAKCIPFAFGFASMLSVPVFLFPAAITIEGRCFSDCPRSRSLTWRKNVLRIFLLVLCTLVAWLGASHVNAVVAVIGSFCCVPLAFFYPVVLHLTLCRPGPLRALVDCIIGAFGAVMFVVTTLVAIGESAS